MNLGTLKGYGINKIPGMVDCLGKAAEKKPTLSGMLRGVAFLQAWRHDALDEHRTRT